MDYFIKTAQLIIVSFFFACYSNLTFAEPAHCNAHQIITWQTITLKKLHAKTQYQLQKNKHKIVLLESQWNQDKREWSSWSFIDTRRFGRGLTTEKVLAWAHKKVLLKGYRPHFYRSETPFVSWHCSLPQDPQTTLKVIEVTEVAFATPTEVWSGHKAWLPCSESLTGTNQWQVTSQVSSTHMSWMENCQNQESEWLIYNSDGVASQWYRFPPLTDTFTQREVSEDSRDYDVVGINQQGNVAAVSRSVFNLRGGDFSAMVFEVLIHRNQGLYRLPEHKILTSSFVLPQARLSGDGEVIWLIDQHRVLRYHFVASEDRYVLDALKLLSDLEHLRYVRHSLTVSNEGDEAWLIKEKTEKVEGDDSITRQRFKLSIH
jgi:hypothetical protein